MMFNIKSLALTMGLAIIAILNVSEAANAADYYVRSLPGLPDSLHLKSHAGHITIDEQSDSNMFFWLMHSLHKSNNAKLIVWLNGGPACSSLIGEFLETGPFRINDDQTLKPIYGAWNEFANVLYVDQPVGTGFSFTNESTYVKNNMTQVSQESLLFQVSREFLLFLDGFFKVFPEYSQDDIYLAGESYAGTFIPYIANGILKRNNERKTPDHQKYNIRGIAIGNGWIDPVAQYNAYYDFSVAHNLLDGDYLERVKSQLELCNESLKKSFEIMNAECNEIFKIIFIKTCINPYDIRYSYPSCNLNLSWPHELDTLNEYLQRPDVVKAIHATKKKVSWEKCNSTVGHGFDDDKSPPSITLFPEILKQIDVLLYSGDQDLLCNYMGTEAMISNLEWNGYKGFQDNKKLLWYVNDTLAGHIVTERNLTYVRVYNVSHIVPHDAPLESMDMMYRFMGLDHHLVKDRLSRRATRRF